ncbi:MAG TPA: hypothetical protein VFS29_09950 [Motilibacteraceae bacterium]|nr:hypothetical protein [Motilibacteraceae bacterium]
MRLVVLVPTVAERDAVLDAFGPARLARMLPWAGTRVGESGAGTLVVVPVGEGVAAAAAAAGVAANRLQPDALISARVDAAAGEAPLLGGDEQLRALVLDRLPVTGLPAAPASDVDGPLAEGVTTAAALHGVASAHLVAVDLPALALVAAASFGTPWPPVGKRPPALPPV